MPTKSGLQAGKKAGAVGGEFIKVVNTMSCGLLGESLLTFSEDSSWVTVTPGP